MYVYKKKIYTLIFSVIDTIGNIFKLLAGLFCREKNFVSKRILIIRIDYIGDVVTAMSVLEPMRKALPNAEIDIMVPSWAKNILSGNSDISSIIKFDPPWFGRKPYGFRMLLRAWMTMKDLIRNGKYDTVIDLRGDVRHIAAIIFSGAGKRIGYGITGGGFLLTHDMDYDPHLHETDKNMLLLEPLGVKGPACSPDIHISDQDMKKAEELKKIAQIKSRYAVIHAVPGHLDKRWTVEGFSEIIKYILNKHGLKAVMVGSEDDHLYISKIIDLTEIDIINVSGKTNIGILSHVLRGADLFVGIDSGPSHIAGAMSVPSVILFSGVNNPGQWAPRSSKVKVIYPGKGKSLTNILSEEVTKAIDEVLEQGGACSAGTSSLNNTNT